MMEEDYYNWSRPKQEGYDSYYEGIAEEDNPWNYYEEHWQWSQWCDGHMEAYIEDEGK